ncbi:TetR/AcrR family transcriptional regulator; helix-turn-helix transcriptional regulator [Georgenia sp. EYE_87]|uniref:TetR/AcrR family transcriptional regulator n=1 Tax=Georgenia sp. EYE_87 TaxID=2853448 RepID=UPI00200438B7|nr:TetR/AcrR family transcriptional regulator [Georgenia sp. EYE_87]MCK6211400.1 TetR/AcrR family transcriptional regulator; helix-turn-helix transcriptional regulator [Georgenia sp. EYE_87]
MSDSTRPRRRYDAPVRRERAARTRAAVVEAAARVFVERGYAGATMVQIAAEAGVAVETVYRSADGKAALLEAAVQAALAGGAERASIRVEDRPGIRRVIGEQDPRRQLWLYASTQPGVWSRAGDLLRVLDAAASSEPQLAALRLAHDRQRHDGLLRFARLLGERGHLREGMSAERAADILWTVCAQANYDSLVRACGWSHDEYRTWLADTLAGALLGTGTSSA